MVDHKASPESMTKRPFPILAFTGWIIAGLTAHFAIMDVYYLTVRAWELGPGSYFSAGIHGPAAFLMLITLTVPVWLVVYLVVAAWRRSFGGMVTVAPFLLWLAAAGTLAIPPGFWERLFIEKILATGRAGEFMVEAADRTDLETVRAFVSRGVSLKSCDVVGETVLHKAANKGSLQLTIFAIEAGADPNALNRYGNSPMELALRRRHSQIMRYLSDNGGMIIRNDHIDSGRIQDEIWRDRSKHQFYRCKE